VTHSHATTAPRTERFAHVRKLGLVVAATFALQIAGAGPTLASHDGVHGEVTILRGSTLVSGYGATVINPDNETYFVNLWNVSGRDYKRMVSCWGGSSKEITIPAGLYSTIDNCLMSGQWRIQASVNLTGDPMFPTHDNAVVVKLSVSTAPPPA
jgi:hypothetical protein